MFQRQTRLTGIALGVLVLAALFAAGFFWFSSPNHALQTHLSREGRHKSPLNKRSSLKPAEWFHTAREYPDFKPDIQTYSRAIASVKTAAQQRGAYPGFSAPWTTQGPGNIGARVTTIKAHPTNPDIIYIGYSQGGVWKTVNGGQTWLPVFDQQAFLAIGDIELDPQNPNVVYVGTGDPDISGYPFIGDGLWKSTNGGQTWTNIGLENQRIISKIVVHPTNSNVLYAAAMGLPFERNTQRGLYKTDNGGQSWQQVLFLSDSTGVIDLQMAPDNPNVLYAAGWDRIRNNQESVVSGPNARVWKTADGGAHWTMLAGGLPEEESSRIGLTIDRQNSNRVLAMYANKDLEFGGVFESIDGGNSWTPAPMNNHDPGFQGGFAWYFGKIFVNPFNSDDIFICGVTLWRSMDGGENWFQTTPEWWLYEVHADAHDVAFIDANTILLATDGGLYRSSDSGFNWEKIENIPTSQFYRVAYNPFAPDVYYGGMQDNGTAAGNADFIDEWPRLYGGDGFQAVFHREDPNIFYFETQNGRIAGTTDGGPNFGGANDGLDDNDRRHWDMQYIRSNHDNETMYTGTYRAYQGFGHLPFWAPISDDLTDGVVFGERFHTISTLDESPLDPTQLYVGTTDGNLWRGDPFSSSWTAINAGLPDRYVSSVKASPNVANRVFVAHTGYKSNDFSPRLHRSNDRGDTWTPISGDLPNLAINDIQILSGRQDSVLFVATDGGVFGSLDAGQHWERLGSGMPVIPVYDIALNLEKRTLIAGTYARSIMTFPLDSLQLDVQVATHNPPGQNDPKLALAPNPVRNTAMLTMKNAPVTRDTRIEIRDMAGRIVFQQNGLDSKQEAISVDTQHLAAGTYIVYARSNGRVWGQQKFVVSR